MKAKINTGHGRHVGGKTAKPAKPSATTVKSGFGPLEMGNTHSRRAGQVPHATPHVYGRTGKKMY